MIALALWVSTRATNVRRLGRLVFTTGTLALPFLLPRVLNSVLMGRLTPLVAWLSLVSYRDVCSACQYPVYPALQFMHIDTRRGLSRLPRPALSALSFRPCGGYTSGTAPG